MSQDRHKVSQKDQYLKAASLLFADKLSDEEIAAECGVTRRTLARWKDSVKVKRELERLTASAFNGSLKAVEKKAFNTTERLIELATMAPRETNGTISGQVKACLGIAQIRGEIIQRTEDVTKKSEAERKDSVLALLRDGVKRIEKVQ